MIRFLVLLLTLSACAHKEMNIKKALKLCRKIYGPEQELPSPLPKDIRNIQKESVTLMGECYREHVERTRDPRDYVSCGMVTLDPKASPRLTVLSTQEMLPPEIMLQCMNTKFKKLKLRPRVTQPLRIELVFHHIAVTKD